MKTSFLYVPLLLLAVIFLTGCPVSSKYPLADKKDALPFDDNLVGSWTNSNADKDKGHEVGKMVIAKGSANNTYRIVVKEKRDMYAAETDVFEGWVIELNGMKFFVLQEVRKQKLYDEYYVYHVTFGKSMVSSNDISLKVKGIEAITSIEAYQEEVKASMKHPEFHSSKTIWYKQ